MLKPRAVVVREGSEGIKVGTRSGQYIPRRRIAGEMSSSSSKEKRGTVSQAALGCEIGFQGR